MEKQITTYKYSGTSLFPNFFGERHKVRIWILEHPNGNDKIVVGWEQNPFKVEPDNYMTLKQQPLINMVSNQRLEDIIANGELALPLQSTIHEELYNQIFEILKLEAELHIAHKLLEGMLLHYATAKV